MVSPITSVDVSSEEKQTITREVPHRFRNYLFLVTLSLHVSKKLLFAFFFILFFPQYLLQCTHICFRRPLMKFEIAYTPQNETQTTQLSVIIRLPVMVQLLNAKLHCSEIWHFPHRVPKYYNSFIFVCCLNAASNVMILHSSIILIVLVVEWHNGLIKLYDITALFYIFLETNFEFSWNLVALLFHLISFLTESNWALHIQGM